MKVLYWYIIGGILLLALGFVGGTLIHPGFKPGGTDVTNTVYGTKIVYIHEFAVATNSISNQLVVWNDYSHFNMDAFKFIQINDSIQATLWTRSATVKIDQWENRNGMILGGGWDIMRSAPAALAGYHWHSLAIMGTLTISTNLGLGIYGAWLF